uniref:Uncharacterized protein n=1 Tax=Thermosporothrix sp. COM3 TaxID=2490863 RepID=A0A455ST96_9CHLR|nr:hypothetical protein KTC_48730 [Thermosporothrix sp. COM3]BBH90187.1 hypothetical protein KTC_49380 [Thermosporothrix sp. COM3]BBH90252.1 hypothetical protein KTC_50030 [Thermosporothrix sp. COM3]
MHILMGIVAVEGGIIAVLLLMLKRERHIQDAECAELRHSLQQCLERVHVLQQEAQQHKVQQDEPEEVDYEGMLRALLEPFEDRRQER